MVTIVILKNSTFYSMKDGGFKFLISPISYLTLVGAIFRVQYIWQSEDMSAICCVASIIFSS
jgi:hypothetical protein